MKVRGIYIYMHVCLWMYIHLYVKVLKIIVLYLAKFDGDNFHWKIFYYISKLGKRENFMAIICKLS